MTIYERAREKLEKERDAEVSLLVSGTPEYWDKYREVIETYADKLADLESEERTQVALRGAKNGRKTVDRPTATYYDILNQLKASKLMRLFNQLASVGTAYIEENTEIDPNDPFWEDKKEPIELFERWWNEEMSKLPSIEDVEDFLSRISINSYGYLTYDANKQSVSNKLSNVDENEILVKVDVSLLKPNLRKSANKKTTKSTKNNTSGYQSALENVVIAYELPERLESLLFQHIERVCIPKGVRRTDMYQNMLNQFLTYVDNPEERVNVVMEAIQKGWRTLSDGSF